ncbi:DUF983 domain-containing protein [Terrihabitans sp. B22-R8]|uniref:DUF983 domain-containing protein n=1 Tax=Terrihabitans sp. B22-R8 TaxID=3425128 RepID=UPI00403C696A
MTQTDALSGGEEKPVIIEDSPDREWPRLSPLHTGVRGRCPRCGQGHLFADHFIKLARKCEVCGLDYSFADPADGPAFFVMMFFCVPPAFLGVYLEVAYNLPYWQNAAITVPFMLLACLLPLRPLKGWLVASQFFFKAQEGRLIYLDPDTGTVTAVKDAKADA